MTALRMESEEELRDYLNRFNSIESVQRRTRQLNNLCKEIDAFLPRIKKAIEKGTDISPEERETLKGLTSKYSAMIKELDDEFKKYPY